MTLTPLFDPTESAPEVYIYNYAGVLQYTYQTAKTQSSPTQNFRLTDLSFTIESNDSYGHATLLIEDNAGVLLDTTLRRRSTIKREWHIKIKMGKNNAGLQTWFNGKIKSTTVIRPGTASQRIQLECVGWGEILKNKITTIKRNQLKTSNGITLDTTDTSTKIYNLIVDMFDDTDHLFDNSITKISTITHTTGAEGICTECTDVSLANVNELGNSFAGFISRVVGAANSEWYVNADRRIVVRDSNNHDSGFLATNNLTGLDAQGWDAGKLMYIKDNSFAWDDSSYDTMYSWIHAFGHFAPSLGVKEETTPDASDNVDDEYISVPFTPLVDNVFKIAFRMTKTGTPATNAIMEIRGDDGSGKPDEKDIRRTIVITKEILQGLGTTTPSPWFEVPISPKLEVTPGEMLHIVFVKYGTASHTYNVNYKSGGHHYHVSSDGITWSTSTGLLNFRIYDAKRLHTSVENTNLSKILTEQREKLLPIRADLEEETVRQALLIAGETLGRERRVYEDVLCTMPEDRIPLTSYMRMQDSLTGLDIKAVIVSYTVEMHAGDNNSNIGASEIKLTLDDVHAV
tara:strand:+ start:686 stop:2398 length:1713 start_codon:yes stop_codon:yes gene_type:complete